MTANIRHSSEQPKWGTPTAVIDVAHDVLTVPGLAEVITVDPFSEAEFNALVEASTILDGSKGRDGFKDRWLAHEDCPRADQILGGFDFPPCRDSAGAQVSTGATALVNPPGDDSGDNIKRAWVLLDTYHRLGWLGGGALWVAFNLNQFQTLQGESLRHPLSVDFEGLRCVPDKRLAFTRHSSAPTHRTDKKTGKVIEASDAPSHPCFFFLLPAHDPIVAAEQRRRFESAAGALGAVF